MHKGHRKKALKLSELRENLRELSGLFFTIKDSKHAQRTQKKVLNLSELRETLRELSGLFFTTKDSKNSQRAQKKSIKT